MCTHRCQRLHGRAYQNGLVACQEKKPKPCHHMIVVLEAIPLLTVFFGTFAISLRYLYNHTLIHLYLPRDKLKINDQITKCNQENGTDLPLIDLELPVRSQGPLPPRYMLKDKIVALIFALTMALLVLFIVLMMCELTGFFKEKTRLVLFQLTIDCLIFMLLLVVPCLIILLFFHKDIVPQNMWRMFLSATVLGLWFFALHKCGDMTRLFNPRNVEYLTRSFIEKQITEISLAGITTLAILSGIGITLTPWRIWNDRWAVKKEVTATELWHQIQAYNQTSAILTQREHRLDSLDEKSPGPSSPRPGLLSRVQSFASLLGFNLEEKELALEIKSLRNVQVALASELQAKLQQFCAKPTPQFIVVYRYGFCLYCLYRLINVLLIQMPIQLWRGHGGDQRDALAVTLAKVAMLMWPKTNEDQLVTLLSFILSGLLFLCSFNNVVITFTLFSRYLPLMSLSLMMVKNWFKHLAIAELVGIYVTATAILIRTYLPRTMSHQISQILLLSGRTKSLAAQTISEIRFMDQWFDVVFAISCVVTIGAIWIRYQIVEEPYDEELLIETAKAI